MADFTTRDKVALLKDFLNVVGTETEGVEVKVTRDADNGMRFYSDPEVVIEVKNATLAQLDAGTPVYVSGTAASGKPEVSPAQANSATTMPSIGLVQDDIASGDEGFVVAGGLVVGLDTDTPAWDDGTALYVSPTVAGGLTDTRPTGTTELVQKVALVTRRHATVGSVIVMGAGRTNDIPNDLVTLTGVSLGDSDLGTFTGTTIADNETIKGALQDLETAVEAGGGVKYHGRYDTEAETARSGATTTTEIYYTARPDGDGYAESEVSDVGETQVILRRLYYSDKFDADPDTSGDWTAYTTQPADDETFANSKTALLAGLSDTDGTANTRGTLPVSLKMERTLVPNLLLDDYSGAAAAYSVRKLRAAYTGDAMRIREDSGNTETDIGFDSNGDLDTAAIKSFCDAAGTGVNGYVVTWYDQSGNGRDASQSTTSSQPEIYDGSAVFTENGKPIIRESSDFFGFYHLNITFSSGLSSTSWIGCVITNSGTANHKNVLLQGDSGGSAELFMWSQNTSTGNAFSGLGSGGVTLYKDGSSWSATTRDDIYTDTYNVGQLLIMADADLSTYADFAPDVSLGSRSYSDLGLYSMQEFVIWDADQSSNRTGIESNINAYYSIY